ncbi:galactose-1-phosphate uridylyltransferase [Bifidobacterium gallicum]|uniref:Galactose-1-phosphate uridylyltransferase n=1 Tax=Bifidobacterium gallicum DSM 20093 = LMG 11596 TaxID=561180 RepID=D1NT81_9BIFI|nr:galactose-1-phosphate uridylyltransferase [Bifidobacterium gallicum]EFA23883.1 UTP--hexose-1-phosphate uridylyltransferase [Bifidobacterium gallicum DSM 20093 = LMG 11596]KFI59133.1 galactose-1-phosphate uridylyltransferase [Bifidobacterium gallicum DSM 20093 = LMG 11596]
MQASDTDVASCGNSNAVNERPAYEPAAYAREHIRITPTTLADGRQFFYLDDDERYVRGELRRQLTDPRELSDRFADQLGPDGAHVPYPAPQMRQDPLTGDWIPMATARMNRPITTGPGATATGNPLAARKLGSAYQDGEVPDTDYNVVIFENRFPSMVQVPGVSNDTHYVDGCALWPVKPAAGRCEVICFDPDENGLPPDLPVRRLRTVVEGWAFRTAELAQLPGIEQIFPFENHGVEIGVTLAHPHGQIYAYPFIPPKMQTELQHTQAYWERTRGNLLRDILDAELQAAERIVMRNASWVAYVPAAARWPLEVHVVPVRDVLTLDELNDQERWDLAEMYSTLLKRGNRFFDHGDGQGMDLPYIAAWHQAPVHDARREHYRLNLQFFSFRRAANKIKYLAGSESGMAAWLSDTTPELIAARFHELGPVDIAG